MTQAFRLELSQGEFLSRRQRLFSRLAARPKGGVDGVVFFLPHNVAYFTKFGFMVTERPIALALTPDRAALLVPRLEKEHAEAVALVDEVAAYPEYPDERHPMEYFKDLLRHLGLSQGAVGCDAQGAPQVYGYRGPALAELLPGARVETILDDIEALQMIKSQEELELIATSAYWGHRAHELLQRYAAPGAGEVELSQRASAEATREMLAALGPGYVPQSWEKAGAHAGFHGQVGKASALPHVLTSNARLRPGDVLVSIATSTVAGYASELERTMIMGEPTKEQERFFELMVEAQALAMGMLGPGVPCGAVDRAVREFFAANGLMPYWRHHTGHGLGRLLHEPPYLDVGYDRVLAPGMVVSVEPGIYVPELGGFRHSDTVVITEGGARSITTYPRRLEDLVIPC